MLQKRKLRRLINDKDLVEECVTFAEESEYPPIQQLYDVV
jgi:hypothetical protein